LYLSLFSLLSVIVSTCWTSVIVICCGDVDHATWTASDVRENEIATYAVSVTETFALISILNDDVNDESETWIAFSTLTASDVLSGIDANVIYANEILIDFFGRGLTLLKSKAVLH